MLDMTSENGMELVRHEALDQTIKGAEEANTLSTDEGEAEVGLPEINRQSVLEWVAERDEALAGALESLEKNRPDMFATDDERFEFAVQLGRLLGRRDLLEEAAQQIVTKPQAS